MRYFLFTIFFLHTLSYPSFAQTYSSRKIKYEEKNFISFGTSFYNGKKKDDWVAKFGYERKIVEERYYYFTLSSLVGIVINRPSTYLGVRFDWYQKISANTTLGTGITLGYPIVPDWHFQYYIQQKRLGFGLIGGIWYDVFHTNPISSLREQRRISLFFETVVKYAF